MNFDLTHHQKVRYQGNLYVVVIADFPDFYGPNNNYQVVIHPINNVDWITYNINPVIRQEFTVSKGELEYVNPGITE